MIVRVYNVVIFIKQLKHFKIIMLNDFYTREVLVNDKIIERK